MPEPADKRWLTAPRVLLLVALACAAFALRVIGAESSVIYSNDPQLVRQAMALGQALLESDGLSTGFESGFKYPLTLTAYLTGVYGAVFVAGSALGAFESARAFQDALFLNREAIYLLAVMALNLISALLVPVIFLAHRALNPRHSGWLAAWLAATNLLLLQFAHQPRPHVPYATIAFCAVAMLALAVYRGGWWMVAATALSAFTLGALQSGVLILAPFLTMICLRPFRDGVYHWRELISLPTLASLLLFAALSLALYPNLLGEFSTVIAGYVSGDASQYFLGAQTHRFSLDMFSLANVQPFVERMLSYQPIITLLFPLAAGYLVHTLRHRWRLLAVGLSFPLLNLVIWALFRGTFPRITAVLLPFMLLAAAFLIEELLRLALPRLPAPKLWTRLAVCALVALPAASALRLIWLTAQPDTRTHAINWIRHNVDAGEALLLNAQLTPLLPTDETIRRQDADFPGSVGTMWQWLLDYDGDAGPRYEIYPRMYWESLETEAERTRFFESSGIRYIVAQSASAQPTADGMIAYAQEHGGLTQSFCHASDEAPAHFPDDIFHDAWRQIWRSNQPGPYIRIYDLALPSSDSESNAPCQR